jgi:transposase
VVGATNPIFLIVDRSPAHRSRKTKAFVETLGNKLELFFLPAYSPDRNPDELVWKHLKADTAGRMALTSKVKFKGNVISSLRRLQNDPDKIRSFYQKPSLKYAA